MQCVNILLKRHLITALIAQSRPKLQVATKYALVELTPPKVSDIPAIRQGKLVEICTIFEL